MKTLATALLMIGLVAGTANARSVFDDVRDSAPRSVFDEIQDSAPRTIFDEITDSAPLSDATVDRKSR